MSLCSYLKMIYRFSTLLQLIYGPMKYAPSLKTREQVQQKCINSLDREIAEKNTYIKDHPIISIIAFTSIIE